MTRSSGRAVVTTTRSRAVARRAGAAAALSGAPVLPGLPLTMAPTEAAAPFAAELREVEYWRRLVLARLDLAVAAVTAAEEPTRHTPPGAVASARPVPADLRRLVGLTRCDALDEAGSLEALRDALDDLDCYARALRAEVRRGATSA